jgi:excisionase family DNA binding protein
MTDAAAGPGGSNKDEDEMLTPADVGRWLKISRSSTMRMIHAGELPAYKVGGQYRLSKNALQQWLAAHQVPPGTIPWSQRSPGREPTNGEPDG